ncbi:MAG: galactose mutarotase [Dysgonamonadaceae bacterium]|jgi:aldose 1-epimerase|nr:galactose mutarotase [Dysgonamonadaceae bacterium]
METLHSLSGLEQKNFEQTVDGKPVKLFLLKNNNGAQIAITNYGARIAALIVPDKYGKPVDVVLGKNSIEAYLDEKEPYFGAICGRTANRIDKATFRLNGRVYRLKENDKRNSLHGGVKGFHAVVWEAKQLDNQTIELSYLSPDREEGYPGNLAVTVVYTLSDKNELRIAYTAKTDKITLINLTNHSYFNLSGEGNPTIEDHLLEIDADSYLPATDELIPLGRPEMVEDTPFDFRKPRRIGDQIEVEHTQLIFAGGYDHNYVLNRMRDGLQPVAKAASPKTGITLNVLTTEPGLQLYTGNFLNGGFEGKNGHTYPRRSAFCLETQHFPDSIHHPNYPTTVLRPEDTFKSETVYVFGAVGR